MRSNSEIGLWVDCQESDNDNGGSHKGKTQLQIKPLKIFSFTERC